MNQCNVPKTNTPEKWSAGFLQRLSSLNEPTDQNLSPVIVKRYSSPVFPPVQHSFD
jgi:hypothetical protein